MKTRITKRITLSLTIIVLSFFTATFSGFAQMDDFKAKILQLDRDDAIRLGYMNLNGVGIKLNYLKAYYIFLALAENGDAEANNVIGMMYKQGLGPKQNDEKAFNYFQKAAEGGYAEAAYNIALMYKYGHGVEQDLSKHIEWLEKADQMGYEKVDYLMGYAYYKGFGEKQDYHAAFQYFEKGAQKEDGGCMLMLGICYFHGWGVDRDAEQGKFWMDKAADKGVGRAVDIMSRSDSKTYGEKTPFLRTEVNDAVYEMIPLKHSLVLNDKNIVSKDILGEWEGCIVQYDWSGEEIEKERKLKIVIDRQIGNEINGLWIENDTMSVRISASVNDSVWVFDNVRLYESQRPLEMKTGRFRLANQNGKEYLIGNIAFYSEKTREYAAPNHIALEHKNKSITAINSPLKDNEIIVSPNPFNEKISVKINLERPQKLRIVLYDLSGKKLETSELLDYKRGEYVTSILTANYSKGSYILNVVGETINKSFTLIK